MEIFAHALWATAVARTPVRVVAERVRWRWFALWAVSPDLFAFAPGVAVALWLRVFGVASPHHHGHHVLGIELYDPTHSLVVFAPLFAAVWLIRRRPAWCMLGWSLHILMDIPTHSAHFPTPFLWPLSSYRFIGISWAQWRFMAFNYSALGIVFFILWMYQRRKRLASRRACQSVPLSASPIPEGAGPRQSGGSSQD